jgi:hypothetical protein
VCGEDGIEVLAIPEGVAVDAVVRLAIGAIHCPEICVALGLEDGAPHCALFLLGGFILFPRR